MNWIKTIDVYFQFFSENSLLNWGRTCMYYLNCCKLLDNTKLTVHFYLIFYHK